jgi:16S rRNA (adenine1518-N6/adenine1519-N6)-dimethyltransferase
VAEDGLPPLREVIARHGLGARKGLGQNFLFDLNLTRRIARAAAPLGGHTVVEVGPGPGGLTRALLMEGADRVLAVERDERALPALHEIAEAYPGKLRVEAGDALDANWSALVKGPAKIVANLPYNVATPLLLGWFRDPWPPWFSSLTLMFQKEVAERITAAPGSKAYGRLAVICQWRCAARKLFDVHPSAFTPQPKVTSSVVQLVPLPPKPDDCGIGALERVTAAAFGQRRKMLRSSLSGLFSETDLVSLGIEPTKRAEELPIKAFMNLARRLG